jgi:hypothetical protein
MAESRINSFIYQKISHPDPFGSTDVSSGILEADAIAVRFDSQHMIFRQTPFFIYNGG